MIKNIELENNDIVVTYNFSNDELNILIHLKEHKFMEFRKGEDRNKVNKLLDYGFLTNDYDSWHFTVVLTELGKQVVNKI